MLKIKTRHNNYLYHIVICFILCGQIPKANADDYSFFINQNNFKHQFSNIKISIEEHDIEDIAESRNLNENECEISISSRFHNLTPPEKEFYLRHELNHCYETRSYIYNIGVLPTVLDKLNKKIYEENKRDYLKGEAKQSLGIVYQEMLADGFGTKHLIKIGAKETADEIYNLRKNNWLKSPCENNYPTMGVIDKIIKNNNLNDKYIESAVNKEFNYYIKFYKKHCKPLQE